MNYYIYILECSDRKFYTGVTNNLERRVNEHNLGEDKKAFTYSRRPVKLVYSSLFSDIDQAIAAEKQIKGWNRKKKEVLISGNYNDLPKLSERRVPN